MTPRWCSIDHRNKPSRALDEGQLRPEYGFGHIRHEDDGTYLYCTNSFICARIPLHLPQVIEEEERDRSQVLPEVAISKEALEALDRGSRFRVVDGLLQVEGQAARFPVERSEFPRDWFAKRMLPLLAENVEEPVPTTRLAFNPQFLTRLVEALGGWETAVHLQTVGLNRAITVRPMDTNAFGVGVLMPINQDCMNLAPKRPPLPNRSTDQMGRG